VSDSAGFQALAPASPRTRLLALLLDAIILPILTLWIGYLIWWLIVLDKGQTPGKAITRLQCVTADGLPAGWGRTFLRELARWWTLFVSIFGINLVVQPLVLINNTLADVIAGLLTLIWLIVAIAGTIVMVSRGTRRAIWDHLTSTMVIDV
jgi:uncharacterized RDD family membrane protein YckC